MQVQILVVIPTYSIFRLFSGQKSHLSAIRNPDWAPTLFMHPTDQNQVSGRYVKFVERNYSTLSHFENGHDITYFMLGKVLKQHTAVSSQQNVCTNQGCQFSGFCLNSGFLLNLHIFIYFQPIFDCFGAENHTPQNHLKCMMMCYHTRTL